jgi:hypothetical protein
VNSPKGRYILQDLGVDGIKILRWIESKKSGRDQTELIWLRTETDSMLKKNSSPRN